MSLPTCRIEKGSNYLFIWPKRFSFEFVAHIKEAVPPSHRDYDAEDKKWTVFAPYALPVSNRLHNYFTVVEEDFGQQKAESDQAKWQRYKQEEETRRRNQQYSSYQSAEERFEQQQRQQSGPAYTPPTTHQGPYAVLFLTEKAPAEVIKASWKACMLLCHPDKNQHRIEWATAQSKAVNEAYQTIKKLKGF